MRAFCCENVIYHLIKFIRENNLQAKDIKFIEECLKEEIIPYLLWKYPKSEDSETNLKFARLIRKVDNFDDNRNNLVHKSKVKFSYND